MDRTEGQDRGQGLTDIKGLVEEVEPARKAERDRKIRKFGGHKEELFPEGVFK